MGLENESSKMKVASRVWPLEHRLLRDGLTGVLVIRGQGLAIVLVGMSIGEMVCGGRLGSPTHVYPNRDPGAFVVKDLVIQRVAKR